MQDEKEQETVVAAERPERTIYCGVEKAAAMAGCSRQHVSQVARGTRPGSAKVWDAIEAAGVRNGLTGRLAKRPQRAAARGEGGKG